MNRRTGHEGLHTRVVEGDRRRLEHGRAARHESERRDVRDEKPAVDERVLYERKGVTVAITRHRHTGHRAVQIRRLRPSGFCHSVVLFGETLDGVIEALNDAADKLEADA